MLEFLIGFGMFAGYYLIMISLLLTVKMSLKPPKELFRKMLHLTCTISILVLLYVFDTWYLAFFAVLLFAIALYPLMTYAERFPRVMEILIQRRDGEIKSSLIIVFYMMAVLIGIFWGWLGEEWKYIIVVSIMAWGFGDAAAALIGKAFGHNPIKRAPVNGSKTWEGTTAMYSVSAAVIFVSLLIKTSYPWYLCLAGGLLVAPVCALVELISRNGIDTITVPFAAAISLSTLRILFTFMGV